MRMVLAVLKPAHVESVREALAAVQVTRLTICDAQGFDPAAGGGIVQEAIFEIAVNDDFVDRTVGTITATLAAAGTEADGRVLVLPMDEAVQLYREVRGPEAV